jgi:hypothetical protein
MPIAKGISKQVAIKKESTWGTLAGASGARYLRRVTSAFNLTKETYQSDEIRTDYQMADYRHGVRSAEGSISAEFSPGSYSDLFAAALARDFTSGVAITGAAINTAAGAGSTYTLTRGAGSYFSDGFRVGDVVRITVIASGFEEGARKSHSAPVFSPQEERRSIFGSLSQQPSQPPVQAAPVRQEQPPEPEPIPQPRPEIRKPMFSPKPVDPIPKQVTVEEEDTDDLEIPAFIRKKMR